MNQDKFELSVKNIINNYKNGEDCNLNNTETSILAKKVYDQMNYNEHITNTPVDVSNLSHNTRNSSEEIIYLLNIDRNHINDYVDNQCKKMSKEDKNKIVKNTIESINENKNLNSISKRIVDNIADEKIISVIIGAEKIVDKINNILN